MSGARRSARVRRTGIALVHQGEVILPAPGAEALLERGADRGGVHYHFPVEIEIIAGAEAIDTDALAERVLAKLSHGLDAEAEA